MPKLELRVHSVAYVQKFLNQAAKDFPHKFGVELVEGKFESTK